MPSVYRPAYIGSQLGDPRKLLSAALDPRQICAYILCHGHNRACVFLHVRVRSLLRAVGQLLRFLRFDMDVTLFYFHVLSNTNAELFDMSHKFLRPPACVLLRA